MNYKLHVYRGISQTPMAIKRHAIVSANNMELDAHYSLLFDSDLHASPFHTGPYALGNSRRELSSLQPLVNQPHAYHKLFSS